MVVPQQINGGGGGGGVMDLRRNWNWIACVRPVKLAQD